MQNILSNVKNCKNCGAMIEAREMTCKHCNHVFEPIRLTPEEKATSYAQICEDINNAFFRFEGFMYGNALNYQSFNFDRAFSVLFIKTREAVNYNPKNFKLIGKYWELTQQITYDHDKTNYTNYSIDDNEDFINDLNAIYHLYEDRLHEFNEFTLPEDWEEKRLSILDIKKDFFESKHIEQVVQPKQILKKSKKKSKEKEVKNEFSKLINEIENVFKYNYPALEKPLQFYYNAKECIRKFKYVTPIKFRSFSKRETILALKHFDFVINELLAHAQTDFKTIEKWLLKYRLQYQDIFQNYKQNNPLIEFLNEKLPSLRFSLSDEYNKDQEHIQYDFFNYWYGFFLVEASTFVVELNEILNPNNINLGYNSSQINTETLTPKRLEIPFFMPKLGDSLNSKKDLITASEDLILKEKTRNKNSANIKQVQDFIKVEENKNLQHIPYNEDSMYLGNQFERVIVDKNNFSQDNFDSDINSNEEEIKSIIIDFLEEYYKQNRINKTEYDYAVKCILYFVQGKDADIKKQVTLKGRIKKEFGYQCGNMFRELFPNSTLNFEYLHFLTQLFSVFKEEQVEKSTFQRSRLYKYLTAKK